MIAVSSSSKLLVLLTILAFFSIVSCTPSTNYDNYTFSLEWQGTVCKFRNCDLAPFGSHTWNVHGLWPNAKFAKNPKNCTKLHLHWDSLSQDLKRKPSLLYSGRHQSQRGFFTHEWEKHGTCWNPNYGIIGLMPVALQSLLAKIRNYPQNSADYFYFIAALS